MQTEAVLAIGGNKGDREKFLTAAREALQQRVFLKKASKIYETEAWGEVATGGDFLNQLLLISTSLAPLELLGLAQEIENALGRTREQHWGDRTMDIDLIYYGDLVQSTSVLQLPHPFLAQRRFILLPLVELLPDRKHSVSGKTSLEMLQECTDTARVEMWEGRK